MGWRVVNITSRCKLEYSLNMLIHKSDVVKKIYLDEIELLIISSTQVSISTALLLELTRHKIKLIFCDEKAVPYGELEAYSYVNASYKKLKNQICWDNRIKDFLWQLVVREKLCNQSLVLEKLGYEEASHLIAGYIESVKEGDITNREGHAAKVFFNSAFGSSFSRGDIDNINNKFLNYGYSILASKISQSIKKAGYLTEIGIHHIGETNKYNFTYDLIEPLRSLVDYYVLSHKVDETNYKSEFIKMLNYPVIFDHFKTNLLNAVDLYVNSFVKALETGNWSETTFIKYEL